MAFAKLAQRISWSFLSVLLLSTRIAVAFPATASTAIEPNPIQIPIPKFPNAALDKSLKPDTIGRSGIHKTVPAQIHSSFPAANGKQSASPVDGWLTPDTIGYSGIRKSVPIQIHFPDSEPAALAEALLIPDTLGHGGTGFSASLRPDTIGNSGISKSISVQIHFPAPEGKKSALPLDGLLTPDTIGYSGIGKSVPVQIHFPAPEHLRTSPTLGEFLIPDTIGNSGYSKSIPIQIHFPTADNRISAEPFDAFLVPDTIGYSGIKKSITAERKVDSTQSFSLRLKPSPASKIPKDSSLESIGLGTLRTLQTTPPTTEVDTTSRTDGQIKSQPVMSKPATWLAGKAAAMARCILPLSFDAHKGSSGRVAVLGGSAQYTGAPYYAAMASLKAGADLAYVFCAQEACLPIKSYSPELMVAPVYNAAAFDALAETYDEKSVAKQQLIEKMVREVASKLEHLHVLVIGPGLGRCPLVCQATAHIIKLAQRQKLAMVLDADALWMLAQPEYRDLFEGYNGAPVVLTPNVVEYKRLLDNLSPSQLQSTTIVRKGLYDVIVQNGQETMQCQQVGGKKRSGGIGDVLAGTIGTLVSWNRILNQDSQEDSLALSCWTACCFVKHATKLAFDAQKRSMTAPDVLEHLGPAVNEMTEEGKAL